MSATAFRIFSLTFGLFPVVACSGQSSPPAPPAPALSGEWTLVELNSQPAPTGAGGRSVTLHFEAGAGRVAGFAGCNRLATTFAVAGDSVRFGAAVLTRMACVEGLELERSFVEALTATSRYTVTATELTLLGASGALARFARAVP